MVENIDISAVVNDLSAEFGELIDEREDLRTKSAKIKARLEEIERKLAAIQQTLHGFSAYTTAQEAPTEITKKTTLTIADAMKRMERALSFVDMTVPGPDVKKTLTECIRDILRQKKDWMTPVEVREALHAANFDFSNYTSNPLSSIHTALKRMVPEDVDAEERGDGQAYRWKTLVQRIKTPQGLVPMNTPGTKGK